ncbi:hypothetical protein BpHYR1_050369 [Brachionus plicatilis]|uniref:Apple domain-containing protein n=1 Tax=Brachionus plicatilis TaxID=10195 RepID=A0A3M7SUT2_BRAPC|nr:hypothetical protein BpHYR1_050369 [Brachionus plicatilis]
MILEKVLIFLIISLVKANILSESYNVFENSALGSVRRIFLKTDIPKNIERHDCLIECNKRYVCLTAYFKKTTDSSLCELLFTPYKLTNAIISSLNSTIYQKKIPTNYIGSVILLSIPKATVIYWNRESKYFMVKYSIDNEFSWIKTNDSVSAPDKFDRNSTIDNLLASNLSQCENFCLNNTDCYHFTYYPNTTCELKSFAPNNFGMSECSNEASCFSLVANNETFVNIHEYPRYYSDKAYKTRIAFYSDDDSIWSDWHLRAILMQKHCSSPHPGCKVVPQIL